MHRMGLTLLLLTATAASAQDAAALQARSLAASCAACHGTLGHGVEGSVVPPLAGRPALQIDEQMKSFRSGSRVGTVMPQIAKGYSDAQIEQIARLLAKEQP